MGARLTGRGGATPKATRRDRASTRISVTLAVGTGTRWERGRPARAVQQARIGPPWVTTSAVSAPPAASPRTASTTRSRISSHASPPAGVWRFSSQAR